MAGTAKYLVLTKASVNGMKPAAVKELLNKFRAIGGEVFVDRQLDRFILVDDRIPPKRLDEAIDIFEGHNLEIFEVAILHREV